MPNTEVDWTFDSIPADGEEAPRASPRPPAGRPPGPRSWRRRLWFLAMLLGLAAAAGLSLYLVYWNGWQRVRAQLAQEIAYEDTQSLAGNAGAVTALQWPGNQLWVNQRGLEAALGWPARPPAENLLPVAQPGRLLSVELLADNEVEAIVLRSFTDAAGAVYDFEYVQRYRSSDPGLWQRQAPMALGLGAATVWAGQRLTATLPAADEAWLAPLLPQLDAYLVRACADWQCPESLRVPLTFSGRLEEQPRLAPARRLAPTPGGPLPYPITFDLIFRTPRYPRRVILPALYLAGRPHDEAAQAALMRATAANLLAYLATELSQATRSGSGDYLDALIAREEIRLGLSPAPQWTPSPATYQPPETLWPFSRIGEARARRADITARLQALAFLDFALGASPPAADAALLRQIRFYPRLDDWLSLTLDLDGPALVAGWQARTTAAFAAAAPPRWDELEGLAYVCAEGAWLVRGGRPTPLVVGARAWLPRQALSADGQYLAVVEFTSSAVSQIRVLNLADQTSQVVDSAGLGLPLGWTPAGDLLYLTQGNGPFAAHYAYELRLFHPGTEVVLSLSAEPLVSPWGDEQSWSTDHTLMAVTLVRQAGADGGQLVVSPGVIALTPPIQALRLPGEGYAAAIAPDGRHLAYVTGPLTPATPGDTGQIEIINLTTQAVYGLLPPAREQPFYDINSLTWSPDGRRLAFLAYEPETGASLYVVTFEGADPAAGVDLAQLASGGPALNLAGFSADGRYLAAQHNEQSRSEVIVYDLETGQPTPYLGGEAAMPWSPRGHLIALGGPGGLYVVDPASGEVQWVTSGGCRPNWFELP